MTIGETLKQLRLDFNLTQKQIGAQCLMSDSQIRRYENGYSIPKASTLESIIEAILDLVLDPDHPNINHFFFYCIEFNKKGRKELIHNIGYNDFENLIHKIYYFDIDKNKVTVLTQDNTEELNRLEKIIQKSVYDSTRRSAKKYMNLYLENVENQKITSKSDATILCMIQKLNDLGKQKAIDYMDDLAQMDKYKK